MRNLQTLITISLIVATCWALPNSNDSDDEDTVAIKACVNCQEEGQPKPGPEAPITYPSEVLAFPSPDLDVKVPGGSPVNNITSYPWMASIHVRGRHSCGGSLITRSTVLTAAHCLKGLSPNDIAGIKIYLGHHNLGDINKASVFQVRTVAQAFYHRSFSFDTLQNDIGLLILNQPVETTATTKIVSLTDVAPSDKQSTVAGWGQTCWTCQTSPLLREGTVRIWSNEECQTKYQGFPSPIRISPNHVCAGSPGVDACRGDSGGPLHVPRNGLEQIGIVSFGGECGKFPGVYTRVSSFLDWINKNKKE